MSAGSRRHDLVVVTPEVPGDTGAGTATAIPWGRCVGGACAALPAIVAARGGAWVGADRGRCGETTVLRAGLDVHRVSVGEQGIADRFEAYCAGVLAPLYFGRVAEPRFTRRCEDAYRAVNHRVAVAADGVAAAGGLVWVHDFPLQQVPGYLRGLRPDLRIGLFLHSPFPPVEQFMCLPARHRVLLGLLGADVLGFEQPRSAGNFLAAVRQLLALPTGERSVGLTRRRVTVIALPSSVDVTHMQSLALDPDVRVRGRAIRAGLGNPRTILLSVSPLDDAGGVERGLDAYADLLASRQLDPDHTVLVQVTTPAGELVTPPHRRQSLDRRVAEINGQHARLGRPAVHYLHRDLDRRELVALYLAADVLLALPLHSGTTPTAKEYLCTRLDGTGRVVLSECAAAAADLPEAMIVNPYDPESVAAAIAVAVVDAEYPCPTVRIMRERVRANDARQWAHEFLSNVDYHVDTAGMTRAVPVEVNVSR